MKILIFFKTYRDSIDSIIFFRLYIFIFILFFAFVIIPELFERLSFAIKFLLVISKLVAEGLSFLIKFLLFISKFVVEETFFF